jgi:four helix bundle protein
MRIGRLHEEFRDRCKAFAASVIRFYVALDKNREEIRVCGRQMLRSGTSVAAHIREASRARSDAEFVAKLGVASQEADETMLWIELLTEECQVVHDNAKKINEEADEIISIVTSIIRKTNTQP